MKQQHVLVLGVITAASITVLAASSLAEGPPRKPPATASKQFIAAMQTQANARPALTKRANELLARRYDLSGKGDPTLRMSGGKKPVPVGPTARLKGISWDDLAALTPGEIKRRGIFPYPPLPHPLEPGGGGMVFPPSQLRSHPELDRVDVGFDIPDAYLPEFPPPLFLTTHPQLGDVSQGQEISLDNYYALLSGVLSPLQLDGLRLLVTTFPTQQFNQTEDRVTWASSDGVSCFSCHVNGHTTGQFHRTPDLRPTADRTRLESPTLRGLFVQRTFGSKRAIRTLEDFTEVEANTAYFDGDDVAAQRKGARHFSRPEVAAMAAFQNIIGLPPAPKLLPTGELDPTLSTPAELRGEALFQGKARCSTCHPSAYSTDNLSHDLRVERFYEGRTEGIFKTFTLRGIKDSPPYLHDGRLLTLEDTVEFFNLVLGTKLSAAEKRDVVAYLRVL
jgi:cytochrome c peroxidase